MKLKKKICIECKKETYIFSKGRCKQCSMKSYKGLNSSSTLKKTPLKKITNKTQKKRQEERKDYPEFFKRHIEIIRTEGKLCEECGSRLNGSVDEVAHILTKNKHKSVATNDNNVVYLCGAFSKNQCHYKFDNRDRTKMKVFNIAKERFKLFEDQVTEYSKEKEQLYD